MGFNNDRPQVSFVLSSQTFIQARVLFDILFDDHLRDLSKYKVFMLADQECLDDDKIALIESYVFGGGGLVATEYSSLYTEWRLRRPDFGLKKLFGVTAPPWKGRGVAEKPMNGGAVRNPFGAGRVVYLSEMKPTIEKPPAVAMTSEYWNCPVTGANWLKRFGGFRRRVITEHRSPADSNCTSNGTKAGRKAAGAFSQLRRSPDSHSRKYHDGY